MKQLLIALALACFVQEAEAQVASGYATTNAPSYGNNVPAPLSLDRNGSLRMNCTTGCAGGGGGTVVIDQTTPGTTNGVSITDGTNFASVKAASTSPALADKAVVVVQSPNPTTQCPNFTAINQTASTDVKTYTNFGYICAVMLVSGSAQNIGLIEGTGATCGTGTTNIIGGAAGTVALTANGGFSQSFANPLKLAATADHLCVVQSSSGNVSGVIQWADHA